MISSPVILQCAIFFPTVISELVGSKLPLLLITSQVHVEVTPLTLSSRHTLLVQSTPHPHNSSGRHSISSMAGHCIINYFPIHFKNESKWIRTLFACFHSHLSIGFSPRLVITASYCFRPLCAHGAQHGGKEIPRSSQVFHIYFVSTTRNGGKCRIPGSKPQG